MCRRHVLASLMQIEGHTFVNVPLISYGDEVGTEWIESKLLDNKKRPPNQRAALRVISA
ncbi:hypothetical protein KKIDH5335_23660 [Vibrio fluvialis]|nr:hypothetical protein KKIDH5335_23660 [Vibrio fluvialis]